MNIFHCVIKKVADFELWNNLPAHGFLKSEIDPLINEKFFILSPHNSFETFETLAEKTVAWIKSSEELLTKNEEPLLAKLKVIFLSRLSQNNETVKALIELTERSQIAKDHASHIPHKFKEVTRYLPNCDEWLDRATGRKKEIQLLCKTLQKADWDSIANDYAGQLENLPLDSLSAFHDEKITMEQFTTLIFYWSAATQFHGSKINVYSIYNRDGTINSDAEQAIFQTMEFSGRLKRTGSFLDNDKMDVFLRNMLLQPESERIFFSIQTEKFEEFNPFMMMDENFENNKTLCEELHATLGFNIFHQYKKDGKYFRMIPSLSMMQQFLVAYAGDDKAVKIIPVIGLSTPEDIVRNSEQDTRDMALPFPGIELPEEADFFPVPYALDFIHHDFYHSTIASDIPPLYRRAFAEFGKFILQLKKEYNDALLLEYLDVLYERIIDMEHLPFKQNSIAPFQSNDAQKFLISINLQQPNTITRIARIHSRENGLSLLHNLNGLMQIISYQVMKKEVNVKLACMLDQQNFCSKYGINREDLNILHKLNQEAQAFPEELKDWESNPYLAEVFSQEIDVGDEKIKLGDLNRYFCQEGDKGTFVAPLLALMDSKEVEKKDLQISAINPGVVHRNKFLYERS